MTLTLNKVIWFFFFYLYYENILIVYVYIKYNSVYFFIFRIYFIMSIVVTVNILNYYQEERTLLLNKRLTKKYIYY